MTYGFSVDPDPGGLGNVRQIDRNIICSAAEYEIEAVRAETKRFHGFGLASVSGLLECRRRAQITPAFGRDLHVFIAIVFDFAGGGLHTSVSSDIFRSQELMRIELPAFAQNDRGTVVVPVAKIQHAIICKRIIAAPPVVYHKENYRQDSDCKNN